MENNERRPENPSERADKITGRIGWILVFIILIWISFNSIDGELRKMNRSLVVIAENTQSHYTPEQLSDKVRPDRPTGLQIVRSEPQPNLLKAWNDGRCIPSH